MNILLYTYGQWDSVCLIVTEMSFIFLKIFLVTWKLNFYILILYILFMGNMHLSLCRAVLNCTLSKSYVASEGFRNICQILKTIDFNFYIRGLEF